MIGARGASEIVGMEFSSAARGVVVLERVRAPTEEAVDADPDEFPDEEDDLPLRLLVRILGTWTTAGGAASTVTVVGSAAGTSVD